MLAAVLTIAASYWIDLSEVTGNFCQITEAVPAIPAVAALLLLAALKRPRQETLLVYAFLLVATSMAGPGIVRFLLNAVCHLAYFDMPQAQFLPAWLAPRDAETVRGLYEGTEGGVPWGQWLVPLAAWGLLFLCLWVALLSLAQAFRQQWSEHERLSYPLLYLPLEVTRGQAFFRNPVMWAGFGVACAYNVLNMAHAYNPAVAAAGQTYNLGALLTERPLSSLRPLMLFWRPELVGFGYLVSTEIAFSVWASYAFLKLQSLAAGVGGLEVSGFPFPQEQAMGAYLAMAGVVVYVGRRHLATVRKYLTVAAVAALAVVGWMAAAGMAVWLAAAYTVLLLAVAVVYARLRAEAGVPLMWLFPFWQQSQLIRSAVNSRMFLHHGTWGSATVFSTLVVLSRGYFPALMAYQSEGLQLAQRTGIRQRSMAGALVLAMAVGFGVAAWMHLRSYYTYGAGGIGALEGWGASIVRAEYGQLVGYAAADTPPDIPRLLATAAGGIVTIALVCARFLCNRFPVHPLGFCIATAYGEIVWGSFLIVWLTKVLVFRLAGMRGYKQLIPGFLGLALGHYFAAGIVYGLVGSYGGEALRGYVVHFG